MRTTNFRLSAITIDCINPQRLSDFWATLLNLQPSQSLPGWVRLGRLGGSEPVINFQPVPEPKRGKTRIHVDVTVDDIDEAVATVTQLGGRPLNQRHEYDEGVVVIVADPEDNEFCLVNYRSSPPATATMPDIEVEDQQRAPMSSSPRTEIATAVANALAEDMAKGDVTTRWSVPDDMWSHADVIAKQPGTIAGTAVVAEVMTQVDPRIHLEHMVPDGHHVCAGAVILRLEGPTRSLLTGERTALNFLQRMSGIASLTDTYVQAVGDLPVKILDTRKTVPGLRALDKYAVTAGGGHNHRTHLGAMVLLKENHITAAGDVITAIDAVRKAMSEEGEIREIEVEVQGLSQVQEALRGNVSRIMLDNFSIDDIRAAVHLRRLAAADVVLEASGNVTLADVQVVAATGVDLISVGALTHSAPALDVTMLVTETGRTPPGSVT